MIEIQIVPSDIRRRVRYVFFDRRRVVIGLVALSAVLAGLLGSMAAAPTVIRRVYKDNYLKSMRDERDIQRGRLQENVVQMTSLEKSLEEQRLRVEKLVTVYGLDVATFDVATLDVAIAGPASSNTAGTRCRAAHRNHRGDRTAATAKPLRAGTDVRTSG